MRNVFTIDADIKLKMLINEPTVVQNDDIRFIINVFDNGQPLDLTNVETVSLANVRLDGQTIVTPGTKIDTNIVQFDLGTEETKVPGRVEATAQFYDSEGRVSTISFSYRVVKDPTGDGYIPTEREQTLIETVLGDGPLIIQQAQDAANFANEQGQFAQTQANAANEAATSANEAAQSAANAANEANAAATSANNAAASANAAADNANTKATNAQTQADYAKAQGDYAKAQGDYAKAQGDYAQDNGDYAKQVADENKTRWLTAVNTYADIATTYPNPQLGDTVQTIDDSKIYRWDGTQWVWTQQYNANAITDVQNKIGILNNELSKQNKQSTTIGHGLNIINASQNSPIDIQIEGRTLVNLLGIQGRTATSATVTLNSAKYYVLVNEDGTNVTVDGVSQTVPYKFTGKSSVSLSWTSGKVALYEVDTAEYNNILTTWTASEVNRRYPYVDSVQHVQNPYVIIEGENLLPPFTEWNLHENAVVREPYKLELNATGIYQGSSYRIRALPNQTYTLSVSGNFNRVYIQEFDYNDTKIREQYLSFSRNLTVTTLSNTVSITIVASNVTTGTFIFEKPMLTIGSTVKPFVPRNPSYLFAEVKLGALADKKDILWKDGQDWKVTKWIEKSETLTITNNTATLANNAQADTAVIVDESTGEIYKRVVTLSGSGKEFTQGGSGNKTITFNAGYVPATPKAHYVLATPKTEVVTDKVEGDLVVNGATQVEVGSGFTYTEVDGKRTYTKLAKNQRYNVTSNILSIIANYDNSLKSVVDSVVAKQSDLASNQQALIRSVAELYKRVKALGG